MEKGQKSGAWRAVGPERTSEACHDMFSLRLAQLALSNYILWKHSVLFEKKERKDSLAAWTSQIEREREREREREGKQRNTHSKPNIQMQSWREHKHIESHMHAEKVWRAQGVLQSFFLIGCLLGLASRVWWLWDWKAGQECLATSGTNSDKYPNKFSTTQTEA